MTCFHGDMQGHITELTYVLHGKQASGLGSWNFPEC